MWKDGALWPCAPVSGLGLAAAAVKAVADVAALQQLHINNNRRRQITHNNILCSRDEESNLQVSIIVAALYRDK